LPLLDALLSALVNLVVLVLVPLLVYYTYHRRRHGRGFVEVARRAGLQVGNPRYLVYGLVAAAVPVAALLLWPPPLEPFLRDKSPQKAFEGLGLSGQAVIMALLYGVLKTGFAEEFLFRGLIAGSLARRLPVLWANLIQGLIFLAPHVLVFWIMPELWWVLPIVFVGGLFAGWLRIRSGSIFGPWLLHAAANVTTCLSVAVRTAGG
jgi:membrane protease YdiL (CAAX protease family)